MAKENTTARDRNYEVWEAVGAGAVWVTVTDDRGRETNRQIGGPGGVRGLRIKIGDREAMEYASDVNPFSSGRLRRVDPGAPEQQAAKTDDQLVAALSSLSLEDDLMAETEFNVRRMQVLAETGSGAISVAQLHAIKTVIERRWPQGQPPADQLEAANDR